MKMEHEFFEIAEMALESGRELVNLEAQLINAEHDLYEQLLEWDAILGHIDELLPEDSELHSVNAELMMKVVDLRDHLETEHDSELKLLQEEKQAIDKVSADLEHKNWRAVKTQAEKAEKLHHAELEKIRAQLAEIAKLVQKEESLKFTKANKESRTTFEQFEQKAHHYFLEVYKLARAYATVLTQLIEKEKKN